MILGERLRADLALLLTRPVADEDRPLRVRIHLLQDPHRLEHGERARAVVRRARRAVPRIEVRREHHVLVGLLGALDLGDRVEHRLLAQQLGVEVQSELRALVVLGEAEEQAVVLAAERDRGRLRVVRLEDLDRPPRILGARGDHAGHAALLQAKPQLAGADRQAVAGAAHVAAAPLARHCGARAVHPGPGIGRGVLRPVLTRPAGGLRARDEHELPLRLRQPLHERGAVGKARQDDRGGGEVTLAGTGAVAEHRALQRAHARRHEVDVRVAAPPAAPGAELLVARRNAPRTVGVHQPVVAALGIRSTREPRADRVEQLLRQTLGL